MICPYCDSRVRQVPDNRCCPNCGGPLGSCVSDEPAEASAFPEPPLGVYGGVYGWIEVGESSVRIKTRIGISEMSDYTLRYDELTGVVFQPAINGYCGFLSLRCRLNCDTPFPSELKHAASDATSIRFYQTCEATFARIYAFLKWHVNAVKNEPKKAKPAFPIAHVGAYKGYCGSMEIRNDAVCFTRNLPANRTSRYTIPYEDLVAAAYVPATLLKAGALRVRCKENRNMQFSKDAWDWETSFQFMCDRKGQFRFIHGFLMECARIANEAREEG